MYSYCYSFSYSHRWCYSPSVMLFSISDVILICAHILICTLIFIHSLILVSALIPIHALFLICAVILIRSLILSHAFLRALVPIIYSYSVSHFCLLTPIPASPTPVNAIPFCYGHLLLRAELHE